MSSARTACVYYNGRVHTMEGGPPAGAVAVLGDLIAAVGSDREVKASFPDAPAVNLEGRSVLPGFTDGHCHWLGVALGARRLAFEPDDGRAEVVARVAAAAGATPEGSWIVGRGWDHAEWGGWPGSVHLDEATKLHPVVLTRKDGHALWVNTRALELSGALVAADPDGGVIVRDDAGQPTGIVLENAIPIVMDAVPSPTAEERESALAASWPIAWREGITGCHDMGYGKTAVFRDVAALRDRGQLGLRFVWYAPRDAMNEAIALGLKSGLGDPWLRFGGVKLFLDGTLGSRTAHMLTPYEGSAELGIPRLAPEELLELVAEARQAGMSVAMHAIGDAAVRSALDAVARYPSGGAWSGNLPDRIEHAQLVDPTDAARFGQLGVVASMQPSHAVADASVAESAWGQARLLRAYPWRGLEAAGARLVFGSDAPVERPSVIEGIAAATQPDRWRAGNVVSMDSALRAYTAAPAQVSGQGDLLGTLAPGKLADLTVLDADPFLPWEDGRAPGVSATMIAGQWAWRRADAELGGPVRPDAIGAAPA